MTLGVQRYLGLVDVRRPARRPELEAYPRSAGSLSEDVLVRGYALTERPPMTAACACGGSIDATYRPVGAAVDDHNTTLEHRAWRAAREDA